MSLKGKKIYEFGTVDFSKKERMTTKRGQLTDIELIGYMFKPNNIEYPYSDMFIGKSKNYNLWFLVSMIDEQIHYSLGSTLSISMKTIKYLFNGRDFINSMISVIESNILSGNININYKDFVPKYFTIVGKNLIKDYPSRHTNELIKFSKKVELYKYFDFIDNHRTMSPYKNTFGSNVRININYPSSRDIIYIEDFVSENDLLNFPPPLSNCYYFEKLTYVGYYGKRIDICSKQFSQDPLLIYYPEQNICLTCDFCHDGNGEWFETIMKKIINTCNISKINENKKDFEVIIGCDPEFEIYNKKTNKIAIAPTELKGATRLRGRLGSDGSGQQIEFRPNPGTPEKVTEDMKEIFKCLNKENVSSIGDNFSLGGHIHFGCTKYGVLHKLQSNSDFLKLLDIFIGKPTIELSGKSRLNYKQLSQIRDNDWGFEYRTPPSCIFSNPKISKIILKIAYNLAVHYYNVEKMKIHYFIDFEDYNIYGGLNEKEYRYFINWTERRYKDTKNKNVIKFWTKLSKDDKIEIIFRDKWSKNVMNLIVEEMKTLIVPYHTKFIFYGLENNKFSGMQLSIDNSISSLHPKMTNNIINEGICFGFPIDFRTTTNLEDVYTYIDIIKNKTSFLFELDKNVPRTTAALFPEELSNITQLRVVDDGRFRESREGRFRRDDRRNERDECVC